MASTSVAMSSTGIVASLSCSRMDKRSAATASERLSSLSSNSPRIFGGGRSLSLRRSRDPKICAMAKDLFFNKDGSAIKKSFRSVAYYIRLEIAKAALQFGFSDLFFSMFSFSFVERCEQAGRFGRSYPWSKMKKRCPPEQIWLS
ncbi:hypothetical protein SAY87_016166 [Trapa incisa]|uniref:Uncharacterized protein n=1 Tax=Trapa incisa TaxID=236973 RepID=A0AAN7L825_9MYRT|nr:hypothetical protein SAY87_016166 [Trapa incisa]